MGKGITLHDVGNFQAGVGRASASVGVVFAYIFGGFLVIMAVILAVVALQKHSFSDSNFNCGTADSQCIFPGETCQSGFCRQETPNKVPDSNIPCRSTPCNAPGETCINNQCMGPNKRHPWLLLVALFMIMIAGLMIFTSRKWSHETKNNKSAAQIGGAFAEYGLLKNLFQN